jgi:hypothetical protein
MNHNNTPASLTPAPRDPTSGQIQIESSLLQRAKQNDAEATHTMFRQFIPADEELLFAEYLGVQGLWWVGRHSFACLTNRRICSLTVGAWGEVVYQDGLLEHYNSGVIYQPGLLGLYVTCGLYILLVVPFTCGVGLIAFPYLVQWYYRMNKCGMVWAIREGVSIYLFTNRNRLIRANDLYRLASAQHEKRLADLPRNLLA